MQLHGAISGALSLSEHCMQIRCIPAVIILLQHVQGRRTRHGIDIIYMGMKPVREGNGYLMPLKV